MALFNSTFYDSIDDLDTSISMLVTIGEHDQDGWPIPTYSFAFGTTQYGIDNLVYGGQIVVYPYLKDNLSVGQSINLKERRHVVSNTSIKLANKEVLSPSNQVEGYLLLSDIFSSKFPNSQNNINNSIMNEQCAIWLYTSKTIDTNGIMPIFRGSISDISFNKSGLTLKAEDHIAKIIERQLPTTQMPYELQGVLSNGFEYSMDEDQSNRPVPIVLGNVRHANPVRYRDHTSNIAIDDEVGSVGFQKQYLSIDRVGQMWPNSNVKLLPHGTQETSFLDYVMGGTTIEDKSNSPQLEYKATSLSVYQDNQWVEVVDVKNVWLGGLYMDTYSFDILGTQEILCRSAWKFDNEINMHMPVSTFANEQVMYLYNQEFKQGNYSTSLRVKIDDLSWAETFNYCIDNWQFEAVFNHLSWGGIFTDDGNPIIGDNVWISPPDAQPIFGSFNPNNGLFNGFAGIETSILGISGDQKFIYWNPDLVGDTYLDQVVESNYCGFVGVMIDEDKIESLDFEDWVLIYYWDIGLKTPTEEELNTFTPLLIDTNESQDVGNKHTMFTVDWSSSFLYTEDMIKSNNIVGTALDDGAIYSNEQFVGTACASNYVTGEPNTGWIIANPLIDTNSAPDDIATDWIQFKQKIILSDKDDEWAFGLPAGMGFRVHGMTFNSWNGDTGPGGNYTGGGNSANDFYGGARMKLNDVFIAYLLGKESAYSDLRVISSGRSSGYTYDAGTSLVSPDDSVVVLLEGTEQPIDNPVSMIVHLVEKELGIDFGGQLTDNVYNAFSSHSEDSTFGLDLGHESGAWRLNLNLVERKSAKEVIEDISKSSLLVPIIKTDVTGGFDLRFWFLKDKFTNIAHPDVPIFGCNINLDGVANYNPYANVNDGSCVTEDGDSVVLGCTDTTVGEHVDIMGNCRDGLPPFNNLDEFGNIVNPDLHWAHGYCFQEPTADLTHSGLYGYLPTNHNPISNVDDFSCFYVDIGGCTDVEALNYDPQALWNDGTCEYEVLPTDTIWGFKTYIVTYTALEDDDITINPDVGYVYAANGAGDYNWKAIEFIEKDIWNLISRSFDTYAYDMMEWGWVSRGWNNIDGSGIQTDIEVMMAIIGFQYEIHTKTDSNNDENFYWVVFRAMGYLPKERDYIGFPDNILTEVEFTNHYHPNGFEWQMSPPCPNWGEESWWHLQRYLTDITNPGNNFPIEYENRKQFGDITSYTDNKDLYTAYTFIKDNGYDFDAAEEFAQINATDLVPYVQTLRFLDFTNFNRPSYIEDPTEVLDDCFLTNFYFTSGEDQNLWYSLSPSSDDLKYTTQWLRNTQQYHTFMYSECNYQGLENIDEWSGMDEFNADFYETWDLLYEYPMESKEIYSGVANSNYHINRKVYLITGSLNVATQQIFGLQGQATSLTNLSIALQVGSHKGENQYSTAEKYRVEYRNGTYPTSSSTYKPLVNYNSNGMAFYIDYPLPAKFGNFDLETNVSSRDGQRPNTTGRVKNYGKNTNATSTSSQYRQYATDVDRLIKANEVIDYKISRTKVNDVVSRVKVEYDFNDGDNTYYKSTEFEKWSDLPAVRNNFYVTNGEQYPTGVELLDFYGLDKTGFDEDGTPSEYFASQKILQLNNTSDDATAEKIRRAYLGLNMNQHTILDLTLPLKYCNVELGDYVALDHLIEGKKAYGEDYSLDYYTQTRSEESPYGVHHVRNGQIIYPLFVVESIKYNTKNVKIKAQQVHDWTGQVESGLENMPSEEPIINTLTIENGSSLSSLEALNGTFGSLTQSFPANTMGVEAKTPFKFSPQIPMDSWRLKIENKITSTEYASIDIEGDMGITASYTDHNGNVINFENLLSSSNEYYFTIDDPGIYSVWMEYESFGQSMATDKTDMYIGFRADGNRDNNVDVLDLVSMISSILGTTSTSSAPYTPNFQWGDAEALSQALGSQVVLFNETMDMNFDYSLNVLDVVTAVGIILG
tara:strand:- start:12286 stop:18120 length:5835 start_codon:yes stop_codon:yes gene_type:complete